MADSIIPVLDTLPTAALRIGQECILDSNAMARHYLALPEGKLPLPACLQALTASGQRSGIFSHGQSRFSFRCTPTEEGDLLTFLPAPQSALTEYQLDGVLRQMRSLLGDLLLEVEGQPIQNPGAFRKTYHRIFRLVDNLDLVRAMGCGEGLPFAPVTMDLAGLCRHLGEEAASLLNLRDIALRVRCTPDTLLINGDPDLLQRMLLELISNSARAIGTGSITLDLRVQGNRAILTLTDSGAPLTTRQLHAMLQQDTDQRLPAPNAGAGLGLTIAREAAALHGGVLLIPSGTPSPTVIVALPLAPVGSGLPGSCPSMDRTAGLSPMLVSLSDVLPADLFRLVEMD